MADNPFLTVDRQIIGDIYTSDEAMQNLVALCDGFNGRFAGSEEEHLAADFLVQKLQAYDLARVTKEPVSYTGWQRGEALLRILDPVQKQLPCLTLPHSPPADMVAEIVDVGDGAPEEFDAKGDQLQGKFAMVTSVTYPGKSRRWVHRNEKYGRALLAGAAGFIFVNHYPGYGPATGSIGQDEPHSGAAAIPGVSLSHEDGAYLKRLLQSYGRVRLRLTSTDTLSQATSWNVLADLPGTDAEPHVVMLGCHYDGHDIAQGAADPASGAVALLEAARVLVRYAPSLPHTVRFALWSAEEIGLIGSTQYVLRHEKELDRLRFYLNMDMAGVIDPQDIVLNEWPELAPLLAGYRDQMVLSFEIGQSVNAHSDHYPFMLAGVPTAGIGSLEPRTGGRGYGHTQYDTVDKVKRKGLRESAALAARLALRIAAEKEWPAQRRPAPAVQAILDLPEHRAEHALAAQVKAFYKRRAVRSPG